MTPRTKVSNDAVPATSAMNRAPADAKHGLYSSRNNRGNIFGWVWVLGLIGLMSCDVWLQLRAGSVRSIYYLVVWSLLVTLAICGSPMVTRLSGARWMLRVLTVSVACYLASGYVVSRGIERSFGENDLFTPTLFAIAILVCVVSVLVALSIRTSAQRRSSGEDEGRRTTMAQTRR